ncbi:MAG: hypothetical protein CM1200mP30_11940 [Pseudomonadota bacterium]|nr:MAG: hypothetical protein CM1200mP30_11940 [Pseudomonadota bacterium]
MLRPIDITAEIKHIFKIARATFHDCPKPTIINIRPMMEKLRKALFLLLIEPSPEKFLSDGKSNTKTSIKNDTANLYSVDNSCPRPSGAKLAGKMYVMNFLKAYVTVISENATMYPPKIAPSGWPNFPLQLQRQKLEAVNENKLSV